MEISDFDMPDDFSKDKPIAVAMSGGVDSSLAAALLKARGFKVLGLTLQLYDHGASVASAKSCCAGRDIHDARRVAAHLDMPHYVLDYQKHFQDSVIEDFVSSYARGETPLPCTRCNERVKFSRLLDFARSLGAEALATGHYVRRKKTQQGWALYRARDLARDQSYFLFTMSAEQLAFSCFPLGGLQKSETRALAEKFNLPVAAKPDSQDICFIPSGRYTDLVRRLRPQVQRAGDIVHIDGTHLGRHDGLYQFTPGQRRGLGVYAAHPLYVVGLDMERDRLIVGPRSACAVSRIRLNNMNWIGAAPDVEDKDVLADVLVKLRSSQEPVPARLEASQTAAALTLKNLEMGVARGQACVFYRSCDNEHRMIAGGWIEETDLTHRIKKISNSSAIAEMDEGGDGKYNLMRLNS